MAAEAVDTTFDVEARQGEQQSVLLAGIEVRVVVDPPVGALMVLTRRLKSKDIQDQLGAILELCDKWIDPEDRDELYDAVGGLHAGEEIENFMDGELAHLVEVVSARPTLAQSS